MARTTSGRRKPAAAPSRRQIEARERALDAALSDSFPASDPVACLQPTPPASDIPAGDAIGARQELRRSLGR